MSHGVHVAVGRMKPVSDPYEIEVVDPETAVEKTAVVSTSSRPAALADTPEGVYRELYYQAIKVVYESMRDLVFKETGSREKAVAWIASPFHKRIEREGV